jgi:hypothetical protein
MSSKIIIVFILLGLMLGTGMCFAQTIVLYRENDTALKNVYVQWENYDYDSSVYLSDYIEEAIDIVMEYALYYHRDITDSSQVIVNADDNYRYICQKMAEYSDFQFAVVNHSTGKIVSDEEAISYKDVGVDIRSFFKGNDENMLIIRDVHNPCFETGTMTDYAEYVREAAEDYEDEFDIYIYFGDGFSFARDLENYEELHNSFLSRVRHVTRMALFCIVAAALFTAVLIIVSGKTEPGGKIYPGLSDRLPNDLKLLLYIVVISSMVTLYKNSVYMALRADYYDVWFSFSAEFYIFRSYIAILINACVLLSAGCTIKRQYRLGSLFTNTYIYQLFFKRHE